MRPEQEQLVKDGKMIIVDRNEQAKQRSMDKLREMFTIFTGLLAWTASLAVGSTKTLGGILFEVALYWINILFGNRIKLRQLKHKMENARSYKEWLKAVSECEKLKGIDKWKNEKACFDYDHDLLHYRLTEFRDARELGNMDSTVYLLRTSLERNFAGSANVKLYMKSATGTKRLIEEFNEEVLAHLKMLSDDIDDLKSHIELKMKMDLFKGLRATLGNTALLLSGGGALGVYHIGVLKAILDAGVLPRIIAGSSSGSIIAAMLCTRADDEFEDLIDLKGINYNFIEPAMEGHSMVRDVLRKIKRWWRTGVIFDPSHIQTVLRENLGDITFLEAYQKTKRVLNIAVSSSTSYEMPSLLNYMTAPNVLIWSAVQASCALPLFYPPVQILAKSPNGYIVPWQTDIKWIDGSVENDIPMRRLSEQLNVNHFIVCQVNPHIYPFVALSPKERLFGGLYEKVFMLILSEIRYRLSQIHETGYFRKISYYLLNLVNQPYQGDITIVPRLAWQDYLTMFRDLERSSVDKSIVRGLHSTWPKIAMIKSQCAIELALDEILLRLKQKEAELMGKHMSTESLLDAIQETSNILSCTPILHASMEDLVNASEEIEGILRERTPVSLSMADSVILKDSEGEIIPPEFNKPRMRSRSMLFTPPSEETLDSQ